MSTEKIDHADKARRLLAKIERSAMTSEAATAHAAAAQAHATLALVEQQRIATLAALVVNAARMIAEGTGTTRDYFDLYAKINPQVEEGLGL